MPFLFFLIVIPIVKVEAQENTYVNSVGMKFIRIEPGSMVVGKFHPPFPVPEDTVEGADRPTIMWMGDGRPYSEAEFRRARMLALRDTMPGFEVALSRPYYIGKFEVTQREWKTVMGDNPSVFQGDRVQNADDHPVENVTWQDVQTFLHHLNRIEPGKNYRLPTEFEWEYAARAGRKGDISWGDTRRVAQLGSTTTQRVGQKDPNPWGLYDMLGNVWEWVEDYYNEEIFADPRPPLSGDTHVLKGASFVSDVKNATWLTHAGGPGNGWDVGFRVVLEIDGE